VSKQMGLNNISRLILVLVTLVLSACVAPNRHIQAWVDEGADFSTYAVYRLEAVQDREEFQRINGMIERAIVQTMADKGYQRSDKNAGLILRYLTRIDRHDDMRPEDIATPRGVYTKYQMVAVNEGSFLANLIDAKTEKVVWKGTSIRDLNNLDPKKLTQSKIDEGMHELFSSLPEAR
jgi:hypothetical protein